VWNVAAYLRDALAELVQLTAHAPADPVAV
jgi:hypothetical protein